MAVVRGAGERPVTLLVVAASIIKLHARLAGTPVDVTFAAVRSVVDQIDPVLPPYGWD